MWEAATSRATDFLQTFFCVGRWQSTGTLNYWKSWRESLLFSFSFEEGWGSRFLLLQEILSICKVTAAKQWDTGGATRVRLYNEHDLLRDGRDGRGEKRMTHRSLLLLQPPLQTPLRRLQRLFQLAGNLDERRQTEDVFIFIFRPRACSLTHWSVDANLSPWSGVFPSAADRRHWKACDTWWLMSIAFGFVCCFACPVCEICL